ncbi:gamma-glutamyltransferase family protein [Phenylobacterium sp.]|uniref:gamma-glutamyltransferase family protein n=1 Tax=Phenylobacterium sp. TaxID=1871053 RepID=UPI0012192C8C|nr:gamma-glutamyltransferase family protein [Phenylobacterium sp.]THD60569.1 MAG: gamma-glutamyltransferase family protein [Phenylobacterium sp.]
MTVAKRFLSLGPSAFFVAAAAVLAVSAPATQALAAPEKGPTAMVAAAEPDAVDAGLKVLKAGGSAVDAAVAVQAVLGLEEPQSSGLGGGAFMTYYDAKTRKVTAYNGRETAPAAATPELFYGPDGKPMPKGQAIVGGRSAGVPGAIAMLYLAQSQHGKLAWKDLFGDAEHLAADGFHVPKRMADAAVSGAPQARQPDAVAYFTKPDGTKVQAGELMKNPAYAATLKRLAAEGPKAILEGPIAAEIVAKLREGPYPTAMTLKDLASYKPKATPAVCRPYREYTVCVPPAPSGGPAVLEGLGLLQRTDIEKHPNDVQGWYLFSQASRLMYADRDRYYGDPDFVSVPMEGLLAADYLDARAKLINPASAGPPPGPGTPKGAGVRAPDRTREPGGTTHLVIVDKDGNAVSMTTTVESIFGDGKMVAGFFLNNQLTDFSFSPKDQDGAPAANAPAGGKRPRSSMAPAIVLDKEGRFVAGAGSPGGPSIIAFNLKVLVGLMAWKLPVQEAINLPNLIAFDTIYASEPARYPPGVVAGLAAKGVALRGGGFGEGSGEQGIEMTPNGLRGGADPRREGVARGY